jgi:hypothetical protein
LFPFYKSFYSVSQESSKRRSGKIGEGGREGSEGRRGGGRRGRGGKAGGGTDPDGGSVTTGFVDMNK